MDRRWGLDMIRIYIYETVYLKIVYSKKLIREEYEVFRVSFCKIGWPNIHYVFQVTLRITAMLLPQDDSCKPPYPAEFDILEVNWLHRNMVCVGSTMESSTDSTTPRVRGRGVRIS